MSSTSPITKQQSATEMPGTTTSPALLSPQSPQSLLQPLSPQSPSSAGSGVCSPVSPLHTNSADVQSVSCAANSSGELTLFEGYIARRSTVLKRWKDRKMITVVSGTFYKLK